MRRGPSPDVPEMKYAKRGGGGKEVVVGGGGVGGCGDGFRERKRMRESMRRMGVSVRRMGVR